MADGTLILVAGALLATRVLRSFLFQVSPTDPLTLTAATAAFAILDYARAGTLALRHSTHRP
jgi:hypothetical protein